MCLCFQLPVHLSRVRRGDGEGGGEWRVEWDENNLLSRKMPSKADQMRVVWIGCVTFVVPEDQHDAVQRALAPFRCVPLFLPHELLRDFYTGYCKVRDTQDTAAA